MEQLGVVVPYRDRENHLKVFLDKVPAYLAAQGIRAQFIIVRQANDAPFNRARLLNVGAKELWDCTDWFCFHDVDFIPEEVDYSICRAPTHLAFYLSMCNYQPIYEQCFGGVSLISRADFQTVNGFSNLYEGWGAEDDDFFYRLVLSGLKPARRAGRFRCLPHAYNGSDHAHYSANCDRLERTRRRQIDIMQDGFNQLDTTATYEVDSRIRLQLNVWQIDVNWNRAANL